MPVPSWPPALPSPRGSLLPRIAACLVALALFGCSPKPGSSSPATEPPAADHPAAATPPGGPSPSTGPRVLFAISDGVLAPLVCHDGRALVQPDSTECMELAPAGELVALDTGARVALGETVEAPCNGVEMSRFTGILPAEGPLGDGRFAVWPLTASTALALASDPGLSPTAEELAAMTAVLVRETEGLFEVPPKLEPTSGLLADLDADGKPDRVFATHEDGRLHGVVAAFLARDPETAVPLSVMSHDGPRLVGTIDIDGRPGQEVLVEAVFVEGIEDQDLVSAISKRVYALHDGAAVEVGSWGCRMF